MHLLDYRAPGTVVVVHDDLRHAAPREFPPGRPLELAIACALLQSAHEADPESVWVGMRRRAGKPSRLWQAVVCYESSAAIHHLPDEASAWLSRRCEDPFAVPAPLRFDWPLPAQTSSAHEAPK